MNDRLMNNQPAVLILADFLDGSWHATSFAMQFLYRKKSSISILQTYQNPRSGHFMMRKLSHQLKEITKNELRALKDKLLTNFKIEKKEVNTISAEGELSSILNYSSIIDGPHNIVLCTYNSFNDSFNRQNGCLKKIINTTSNPLFILPKMFEKESSKTILFVGSPSKIPSEQLCNQVIEICNKTESNLEILFVVKNHNEKINEDVKSFYNEHFNGIEFTIKNIRSKRKSKGINNYLKNKNRDLIVIEND